MGAHIALAGDGKRRTHRVSPALHALLTALLVCFALSACSTAPLSPADIKPRFRLANSPTNPPEIRRKPSVAQAQARARRAAKGAVRVAPGDTLYALARQYGVSVRGLARDNRLRAPYRLTVGQRLMLPKPRTHKVRRGETGYGISRRYGVNLAAMMRLNGIKAPYRLTVGQTLRLPGGMTSNRTAQAKPGVRGQTATSRKSRQSKRQSSRQTPRQTMAASKGFIWPVEGRVVSSFGPKEGGIHNDGINIAAARGSAVRAAANGEVVYASDALEGYGNLILVRHPSGHITAYAHNDRLLVREGEAVKQGQTIARVGETGGVPSPQLHFEIRRGRQALNPSSFLRSTARSR